MITDISWKYLLNFRLKDKIYLNLYEMNIIIATINIIIIIKNILIIKTNALFDLLIIIFW